MLLSAVEERCAAWPAGALHVERFAPRPVETAAADVVALTLADPAGGALPGWTPGAHIDLVLGDGLTRQYSLCGAVQDGSSFRIGVLRAPDSRGGSEFIHDALKEGSQVRVRGPRNHFTLVDAPRYTFIAGGIGITPLLPMIESVQQRGLPWSLVYGGRQRASMAFLDELAGHGDRVRVWPQDEEGLLDLPVFLGEPCLDTVIVVRGRGAVRGLASGRVACGALRAQAGRDGGRRRYPVRAGAAAFGYHY